MVQSFRFDYLDKSISKFESQNNYNTVYIVCVSSYKLSSVFVVKFGQWKLNCESLYRFV